MEKSKVWKYFSKIKDNSSAQCLKCPKKISIKGSNTSGLVRHLEHIHKISIKVQSEAQPAQPSTSTANTLQDDPDQTSEPEPKKSKSSIQQTLKFEPINKQSLGEIVSKLAAKDGLTIRQITRSDFIRDSLQQRGHKLPKNESDVMKIILQFYEEKKIETINYLRHLKQSEGSQSNRFSLSIDEWTSLRNRRYFNICLHHTDGVFYNLGLVFIPGKCGAEETRDIVEKRLKQFGLCFAQDVVAVTSDGPNVMVKFGRESPTEMVICLNHAIHLSVLATFCSKDDDENINIFNEQSVSDDSETDCDDDFLHECDSVPYDNTNVHYSQNINKVLKDTRFLAKLFRKSPLKNITLQKYVKEEFNHELNLLLDVRTRWNSTMQMIERFLKLKNAIKKALIDLDLSSKWNEANIEVLKSVLDILHPIKLCIEALSRKDATILTSEAIIDVLINKLESIHNSYAKTFLEHLKNKINHRRNVNLISLMNYLHNPATYTDDKNRPNCSKTTLMKFTEELFNRLFPNTSSSNNDDIDSHTQILSGQVDEKDPSFEFQLKKAIETAATVVTEKNKIQISKSLIKREFQLFETSGKRTPNLESLYQCLMTVKPTSTENERVFPQWKLCHKN